MQALTWTCHICRDERPDDRISVMKHESMAYGARIVQNVRYCNDRPDCAIGAFTYRFIKEK